MRAMTTGPPAEAEEARPTRAADSKVIEVRMSLG
jgi:hypothetical protein